MYAFHIYIYLFIYICIYFIYACIYIYIYAETNDNLLNHHCRNDTSDVLESIDFFFPCLCIPQTQPSVSLG